MGKIMDKFNVGAIMERIKEANGLPIIVRQPQRFAVDSALDLICAMGKERNARFAIDSDNEFVYRNVLAWVLGDASGKALHPLTGSIVPIDLTKGIYIGGPTGTGKSWLLELASSIARIADVRYRAGNQDVPLYWSNARATDVCDCFARMGEFERYDKPPVVGLQDVGSEPTEVMYMGNRVDVIRQLLEHRGDFATKLTLITSNLTIGEIKERYGDRVLSRLCGRYNYYELLGNDRRK